MGKPKPKNKKGGSKTAASKPAAAYSIDDILKKAEECMDEYKYDLAQEWIKHQYNYYGLFVIRYFPSIGFQVPPPPFIFVPLSPSIAASLGPPSK